MITLFQNQKPNKMSKAQWEQLKQEEINRKQAVDNTRKDLLNLADYFQKILETSQTICKERKANNVN